MHSSSVLLILGEIDYVRVLNRALPKDIRVTGWSPVPVDFSARLFSFSRMQFLLVIVCIKSFHLKQQMFHDIWIVCLLAFSLQYCRFSCLTREYKYFFWRGDLNVSVNIFYLYLAGAMSLHFEFSCSISSKHTNNSSSFLGFCTVIDNGVCRKEIYRGAWFQKLLQDGCFECSQLQAAHFIFWTFTLQ